MKLNIDCYPCILRQVLSVAKLTGLTKEQQKNVINTTMNILQETTEQTSPLHIFVNIHKYIKDDYFSDTISFDPCKKLKYESNKTVLEYFDYLEAIVQNSPTPLDAAIRKAAAGNIIAFGAKDAARINIEQEIYNIPALNFTIFNIDSFKILLSKAKTILYIADNAGEIVFDRILIRQIKRQYPEKRILFATRGKPIINDATIDDAYQVGLEKEAEVVSSGCKFPGLILDHTSEQFREMFKNADLILAKGQGNYEGLRDVSDSRIFFILRIKCERVAHDIGGSIGDLVLWNNTAV